MNVIDLPHGSIVYIKQDPDNPGRWHNTVMLIVGHISDKRAVILASSSTNEKPGDTRTGAKYMGRAHFDDPPPIGQWCVAYWPGAS